MAELYDASDEAEDYAYYLAPVEDFCENCQVEYTDYWCEMCGYHGHDCPLETEDNNDTES